MTAGETPFLRNQRIFMDATAAGEPVFVIRAKDRLALDVINDYALAYGRAGGADDEFFGALAAVEAEFQAWADAHPETMKLPDVRK